MGHIIRNIWYGPYRVEIFRKSSKAHRSISENIHSSISCSSNNEYHWPLSRHGTIYQGKIKVF